MRIKEDGFPSHAIIGLAMLASIMFIASWFDLVKFS